LNKCYSSEIKLSEDRKLVGNLSEGVFLSTVEQEDRSSQLA